MMTRRVFTPAFTGAAFGFMVYKAYGFPSQPALIALGIWAVGYIFSMLADRVAFGIDE